MANSAWKIARGKGSAQLPLAIVVIFAAVLVLLGKAHSPIFDRIHTFYSDSIAPGLEQASAPFGRMSKWVEGFGNIFTVYNENQKLKEENARLRQWQTVAQVLQNRVDRYQLLLHAVPDPATDAITARVIGRENRPFVSTMILDAGKSHDVKPGEAVIDARGFLGRIFLAGDHTSWVILATDLNSRIPVVIQPGNVQAMMTGDDSRAPLLEFKSQNAQIKAGQPIVTSGDGGLLPAGLPVGVAVWDGHNFRAALLADPSTSEDVRILALKNPPEATPASTQSDLPAVAAGMSPMAPVPPETAAPPRPATTPTAVTPKPRAQQAPVKHDAAPER
ncbi:MAG TPA: rod shape-determining protein MreC [Rhizomicrobium sp.]|jgi:rod shape-determining protein MreC